MDVELRQELRRRRDEDQRVRQLVSLPKGQHAVRLPDEVGAEWQRVDDDNTRWLGDLLTTRGWPGQTLAGEDGAQAAFLLAQLADRAPALQRAFLDALRRPVDQGEASPAHLAYLEDRVRVHVGQPQLYGTQLQSPAAPSGLIRSRTPWDSTSAAQQRGWNRSLTTRPG